MKLPSETSWRAQRDALIWLFGGPLMVYEIVWAGGRASVLTFLATLILSPAAMRLDEARRSRESEGTSP